MNAVKIVKVLGESQKSWDDAAKNAVKQACKTIDQVSGIEIVNMTANIQDGKIHEYKTTVEIAFPVLDKQK